MFEGLNVVSSSRGIHYFFENNAQQNPGRIALSFKDEMLTYSELNGLANQLANYLLQIGIKNGDIVGISVDRGLSMIVALLAILKAGAAYLPIDPDYPSDRIAYMLNDSKVNLLITTQSLIKSFQVLPQKYITIDNFSFEQHPSYNPEIYIKPDSLAYVLYTSGSTGNPKGVMVSQSNLINAYFGWEQIYKLNEHHCHLQMANFSFDVFTGDLVRALCSGGLLVLCPKHLLLHPADLYTLMQKEKVNCAEFVPTVIRRLMEYLEQKQLFLSFMELVIVGSDNWSIGEYCKLKKLCSPQTRIISSYGLTEATIDTSYFEDPIAETKYGNEHSVPIGKPFPNSEIYIMDKNFNCLVNGEIGEIYIGGKGLSLGYLNKIELTQEKFIEIPLMNKGNKRLYRTGDLGRILSDGNIEFLGRIDTQVKLRGMRIELSDIENVLNCHEAIRESLVVLAKDEAKHERLVAYVVFEANHHLDPSEIRSYLKKTLPSYMVPTVFINLESIPLTPNGKLDRAVPANTFITSSNDIILPQTSTEKLLASICTKVFHLKEIGLFNYFDDLGVDSLTLVNLVIEVEKQFKVTLTKCHITKDMTLNELAMIVEDALKSQTEPQRVFNKLCHQNFT